MSVFKNGERMFYTADVEDIDKAIAADELALERSRKADAAFRELLENTSGRSRRSRGTSAGVTRANYENAAADADRAYFDIRTDVRDGVDAEGMLNHDERIVALRGLKSELLEGAVNLSEVFGV